MIKPAHILFHLIGLLPSAALAQGPLIEWQVSLGGAQGDIGNAVRQTADGGYLVAGQTASDSGDVTGGHGVLDGWSVRLDADGAFLAQHAYGGSGIDRLNGLVTTMDGGALLVGTTNSNDGDVSGLHGSASDAWVLKVDSMGSIQWQRLLGGISNDEASSALQVSDGGFIVLGAANSSDGDVSGHHGAPSMADLWVIKLDSSGELLWQHSFGGTSNDRGLSINPTGDGGFIVAGQTYSSDGDVTGAHGQSDAWVLKLDSVGDLEWQRAYGGSSTDLANVALQLPDGGYVVAGATSSMDGDVFGGHGALDAWVLRLDATGAILWQRILGGSGSEAFNSMSLELDGGLVLAGQTSSSNGNVGQLHGAQDAWVVKLDMTGAILWQKTMGGSENDGFLDIITTADGGHVLAGRSASDDGDATGNAGSDDVWVVRLGSQVGVQEQMVADLHVWPNPSQGVVHVPSDLSAHGHTELVLSDATGRIVAIRTLQAGQREVDLGPRTRGLYFLSFRDGTSVRRGRLIMEQGLP